MLNLSGKSVLLFCPRFFNYDLEIKKSLQEMGATVIWYDDRPSNDFFSKGMIRLNKNFMKRKIKKYYDNILYELEGKKVDYLFFVNPEAISIEIMEQFKFVYSGSEFLLYMWDSFRNRKQNLELLPYFDKKFTFDPVDALRHNLVHRPLFYINTYNSSSSVGNCEYDFLFIGTAHSDRYKFVKRIVHGLDIKIKMYFFLSSKLLYLTKCLFDKDFKGVKFRDISFKSLSHQNIADLMAKSKAILDINHPQQVGLTMRTFESLGAHRKLITTNADVLKYDFYDPANILILDRQNPILDNCFFDIPFIAPKNELLFKYSIKGWVAEIFSLV